jgi:hypothetical protein
VALVLTKSFPRGWIWWGSGPYCRFDQRMEYSSFWVLTVQDGVVAVLVPTWVLSLGWRSSYVLVLCRSNKSPYRRSE